MNDVVLFKFKKIPGVSKFAKSRGSIYRGVSVNCRQWQSILMVESQKVYLCSTHDIHTAARLYDLAAIQTKGFTKVNFDYTKAHLIAILFENSIINC